MLRVSRLDDDIETLRESYQRLSSRGLASSMLMRASADQNDVFNGKCTIEAQEDDDFVLMESKRVPSSGRKGANQTQRSSV